MSFVVNYRNLLLIRTYFLTFSSSVFFGVNNQSPRIKMSIAILHIVVLADLISTVNGHPRRNSHLSRAMLPSKSKGRKTLENTHGKETQASFVAERKKKKERKLRRTNESERRNLSSLENRQKFFSSLFHHRWTRINWE